MTDIRIAHSKEEIASCYPVMSQLRSHLSADQFLDKVTRQYKDGYQLVYLVDNNLITAVAGYRFGSSLAWGKFMYIDDLITDQNSRSKGYGKAVLDWLINEAKRLKCNQLHLDSGVQRIDAHRFYEREKMKFASKHYAISLQI